MKLGWAAITRDGKVVRQGETPYQKLFTRHLLLRLFGIINAETQAFIFRLDLEPNDRVIYRRRVEKKLNARSGEDKVARVFWLVWHQRFFFDIYEQRIVKHALYCVDESTGISFKVIEKSDFFEPPVLYECEIEAGFCPPNELGG